MILTIDQDGVIFRAEIKDWKKQRISDVGKSSSRITFGASDSPAVQSHLLGQANEITGVRRGNDILLLTPYFHQFIDALTVDDFSICRHILSRCLFTDEDKIVIRLDAGEPRTSEELEMASYQKRLLGW